MPGGGKDGRPLKISLDIWDMYGLESLSSFASNLYAGSQAVIVVYSVRYPSSYRSIDEHMNNIDKYCKNEKVLKFLVGHDCDLEQDRRITYEDLLEKT